MKERLSLWQVLVLNGALLLYLISTATIQAQNICPENTLSCESDISPPLTGNDDESNYYHHYNAYYDDYSDGNDYASENESSTCIPQSARCDGVKDCPGCYDEKNCTTPMVFFCELDLTVSCIPLSKRCDNKSDCLNGEDECGCPGTFTCDDTISSTPKCIPRNKVCDGVFDCADHSDEIDSCDVYFCPKDSKKLSKFQLCDGKNDCGDKYASDECNCSSTFVCPTGQCLPNSKRCDGVFDCLDGNDECNCPADKNGNFNFFCPHSGKCIRASQVCDGKLDCGSYPYVSNHGNNSKASDHFSIVDCSDEMQEACSTHFQCRDTDWLLKTGAASKTIQTCVRKSEKCDGKADCDDGSDECDCLDSVTCPGEEKTKKCMLRRNFCDSRDNCGDGSDEKTRGFGFKCLPPSEHSRSPCILPQFMIDDGALDCKGETDQCYRNGTWRCFRCFDGSLVISDDQLCDGVVDCPDLSDECVCAGQRLDLCNAVCGMKDVSDCPIGNLKCKRQNVSITEYEYVPFNKICDGVNDCLSLFTTSYGEFLDEKYCIHEEHSEKDMNCPSGNSINPLRPLIASRCDDRPECAGFMDECDPNNPCENTPQFCQNVSAKVDIRLRGEMRFLCPSGVILNSESDSLNGLPGLLVCNGIVECKGQGEDEMFCPKRYHCDAGSRAGKKVISIDESQKCDGNSDCLDQSDEVNCSSSSHFYCESGSPLYVPSAVRFDGVADCSDKSDECPTKQLEDAFASNVSMIGNPILLAMVWIMAFVSTFGNFIVICHQIMIFFNRKKVGSQNVAMSNRVMLLNLACADFLTGVYLFLLAAKAAQFSGDYCYQDKIWRTSTTCANLGLLNSIATETAVVILILMTTYRLFAVYKPFYTASVSPFKVELICLSGWILVILVMMFPRVSWFSDYFSHTAWYPLPFFEEDVLEKGDILEMIREYHVLTNNLIKNPETTWVYVEDFVKKRHFNESRFAKFGYYSKHSVCIPNMLAADKDAAVGYSAIITCFNLVAFAYVVIAYTFIYRGAMEKTKGRNRQYSTNNSSYVMRTQSTIPLNSDKSLLRQSMMKVKTFTPKSTVMQRRIYRLVFSNLACWVPLTIMAFLKLCGVDLSSDTYAIAAIILLPITSALNPILYSNYISVGWDRVKKCFLKQPKNDSQTQDPPPLTDRSQLSGSIKSAKV